MRKTVGNIFASSSQAFEFVQYFMHHFGVGFDGWDGGIKIGEGNISVRDPHSEHRECQQYLKRWHLSGARVEIEVDDEGKLFLLYALGPHGTIDEVVEQYIHEYCR